MQVSSEIKLLETLHSNKRVEGFTHRFYRYPARFDPDFIREVILGFSKPGDVVLDPFMGGGTTIVETLAMGRLAIGIDINRLAHFITTVKTTPLSKYDILEIKKWNHSFQLYDSTITVRDSGFDPRTTNLPEEIREFLATGLWSLRSVRFPRQRRFIRCALLRVGQWAVESNRSLPKREEMMLKLRQEIDLMLEGLNEFVEAASAAGIHKNKITGYRTLLQASAGETVIHNTMLRYGRCPNLVLTSPPYPGVHVLYHRWQVLGRRETPAPYWIADLKDGHKASHYTMGCRSPFGIREYFVKIRQTFENLRKSLSAETTVVQLVAFSRTEEQLPLYQKAMIEAGYEELHLPYMITNNSIRTVPNRKWYTYKQERNDSSHEVLMIHRVHH